MTTTPRSLVLLASLGLATSVLVGCTKGSPTEPTMPSFDSASKSLDLSASSGKSGGGGNDDGNADDNGSGGHDSDDHGSGGHGADDVTADDHGSGGHGADDGTAVGSGNGTPVPTPTPAQGPSARRPGQQFAGTVLSVNGATLTLSNGVRVNVTAKTQWSARGDLVSLRQLAAAVAAKRSPRVEGRGTRQADGSIAALNLKAEVDR